MLLTRVLPRGWPRSILVRKKNQDTSCINIEKERWFGLCSEIVKLGSAGIGVPQVKSRF
jgi:hypothetical protein